ncbi:MAG: hypothetical protein ACK5VI_10120, partial [Opitutia bacterium]
MPAFHASSRSRCSGVGGVDRIRSRISPRDAAGDVGPIEEGVAVEVSDDVADSVPEGFCIGDDVLDLDRPRRVRNDRLHDLAPEPRTLRDDSDVVDADDRIAFVDVRDQRTGPVVVPRDDPELERPRARNDPVPVPHEPGLEESAGHHVGVTMHYLADREEEEIPRRELRTALADERLHIPGERRPVGHRGLVERGETGEPFATPVRR